MSTLQAERLRVEAERRAAAAAAARAEAEKEAKRREETRDEKAYYPFWRDSYPFWRDSYPFLIRIPFLKGFFKGILSFFKGLL